MGATKYVRLEKATYPDGRIINYDYNRGTDAAVDEVMSRLSAIYDDADDDGVVDAGEDVYASYQYLGAGRIVTEDYEEIQVDLDYTGTNNDFSELDRFGRVVDQIWDDYGASSVLDRYTYEFDRVGNREIRDNELDSSFDEDYTYDALNRLTGFDRADGFDQSWDDLDALGNWSTFDNDGTSQTREVNEANEITAIDSSSDDVAYDAAGNMIQLPKLDGSGDHFHLVYDAWNRLVEVYDDNGTTLIAEYEYDGLNRRIEKETYSGGSLDEARHYYYGGVWQCLEERVEVSGQLPGDADVQYVWGAKYVDNLILRDRDTDANGAMDERLYALADANYNVTALFDEATGAVVERFVYDAYGNVTELDPDDFTAYTGTDYDWEYTYTTRREDAETGLMYYRARYYDADLGRFVSRDPLGYWAGDANLYRYVYGSPVVFVDPSGLIPWIIQQQMYEGEERLREKRVPVTPPPADGRYGRPLAVSVEEARERILNTPGLSTAIFTATKIAPWIEWLEPVPILTTHDLDVALQRHRGIVPGSSPASEPPKISVLEIQGHARSWKFSLGDERVTTFGKSCREHRENTYELIKVLKKHLAQPCTIILNGCNAGTGASSCADPSWVQFLADGTGCTVIAQGGFSGGSYIKGGIYTKREYDFGGTRVNDPLVIKQSKDCYGSKDETAYIFAPRPKSN